MPKGSWPSHANPRRGWKMFARRSSSLPRFRQLRRQQTGKIVAIRHDALWLSFDTKLKTNVERMVHYITKFITKDETTSHRRWRRCCCHPSGTEGEVKRAFRCTAWSELIRAETNIQTRRRGGAMRWSPPPLPAHRVTPPLFSHGNAADSARQTCILLGRPILPPALFGSPLSEWTLGWMDAHAARSLGRT